MAAPRLESTILGYLRLPNATRRALATALLAASISNAFGARAEPSPEASAACEREMIHAANKYDVPLGVLYAVGLTETGRRGSLQPFALNIEGPSFFPTSLQEAVLRVEEARKRGARLIDIGCMQIDHHFHASHFRSIESMFDPRENVDYAARLLKELRVREGSWTMAAARYHAGPGNGPAQKQYVCRVIANLVATGFGAWTAGAREFCRP